MAGDMFGGDDPEERAARRRRAITLAIEAMVTARHAQIMDVCGLPRDSFETGAVEILDPDPRPRRAVRASGGAAARRLPPASAEDSVLRGKPRLVRR